MRYLPKFLSITGIINGEKNTTTTFTIEHPEWTHEEDDDMRLFADSGHYNILVKCLHKRLNKLTEKLVNGVETRDRIDEISDLLLELKHYADPR